MKRALLAAAALATVVALAGCSAPAAEQTVGEAAGLEPVPTIAAQQAGELTAALAAIDARMTDERYLDYLRSSCGDIRDGLAGDELTARAQARITGGTVPDPTAEQAAAFVELAHSSICPTW